MRRLVVSVLVCFLPALLLGACGTATPEAQPTPAPEGAPTAAPAADIANPASQSCIVQGGTLEIRQRPDGGQFGVCLFEDNRQCEEWALLRGDCPVGGLKITGYITDAAQYCAITGGTYTITGAGNSDKEQGTCTFKSGETCDAWEYFQGTCAPAAPGGESSGSDPFAYCAAVGTIDAPDASYTGQAVPDSIVQAMIGQGIVTADAPAEFQKNAVWRCFSGKVWVCHVGANLPCQEKADTSQEPTDAMEEFCTANPDSRVIPAAVTGRGTVYDWKCAGGKPQVGDQILQVDPQGFIANFWYELPPQ